MARPAQNPSVWLRKLETAKIKAASLKRGETLSAKPMAEMLGISWQTLKDWCDAIPGFAESGAFDPGGNGIEWTFRPGKTIAFLVKHYEAERARSARKAKRVRKIVGASALAEVPDEYSLEELSKMLRLSVDLQDAKVKSGRLIDAAVAVSAFGQMFTSLQQSVLLAAQEQDPTGSWPPEVRESFEDATRSILLKMEQAGQDCLRALRGGAA